MSVSLQSQTPAPPLSPMSAASPNSATNLTRSASAIPRQELIQDMKQPKYLLRGSKARVVQLDSKVTKTRFGRTVSKDGTRTSIALNRAGFEALGRPGHLSLV
jgi:hypothetical protein